MGRPRRAPAGQATVPEGATNAQQDDFDDTENIDQDMQQDLNNYLAAAGPKSKAAQPSVPPTANTTSGQLGLVPLRRLARPGGHEIGRRDTDAPPAADGRGATAVAGTSTATAGSKRKSDATLRAPGARKQARYKLHTVHHKFFSP